MRGKCRVTEDVRSACLEKGAAAQCSFESQASLCSGASADAREPLGCRPTLLTLCPRFLESPGTKNWPFGFN